MPNAKNYWDQIIQYGKRIAHTKNKEPNMYYCGNYYTFVPMNNVCALPKIVQYEFFTIYMENWIIHTKNICTHN